MMINTRKTLITLISILFVGAVIAQGTDSGNEKPKEVVIISDAIRTTARPYRITGNPVILDTVIPLPDFTYPLLTKSMETTINVESIEPSKIKIIEKLDKLYPGYIKLGLGNYTMPLGEVFYNSTRNRRMNYGVHAKHLSSFGRLKDYAPTQFDRTTVDLFGDYYFRDHFLESEFKYLNNGYHYYGIQNDSIPKDSLRNRVGAYEGHVRFSNTPARDSAKLLYKFNTDYAFFHEFNKDSLKISTLNVRENNIKIGSELRYKYMENWFALQTDILLNYYKYGEVDTTILPIYRRDSRNNIFSLRPTITTYQFKDKLKAEVGLDLNFDLNVGNTERIFNPIVVANAQYALLKGVLIPYAGIDGDLNQNSFYSLNRQNPFINSSVDIKNTKLFKAYAGLKGSISKAVSFNGMIYTKVYTNMPLFVNDTIFSDQYKFDIVYDKVTATGISGSITYQADEKLKVDAYTELNRYITNTEEFAWNLPELRLGIRGAYNLYNKIIVKADLSMEGGRKSPGGLFVTDPSVVDKYKMGFLADMNLQGEYRYNKRVSGFIQFNNLAHQMYRRWHNYPVYGFQVLGGVTFSF